MSQGVGAGAAVEGRGNHVLQSGSGDGRRSRCLFGFFPLLAKECSDILFSLPHPWFTLDEESKELN